MIRNDKEDVELLQSYVEDLSKEDIQESANQIILEAVDNNVEERQKIFSTEFHSSSITTIIKMD